MLQPKIPLNFLIKSFFYFLVSFLIFFSASCQENKQKNDIERLNNKVEHTNIQNNEKNTNRKDKEQNTKKEDDNASKKRKSTGLISPKWGKRFYKAHNGKIEALEHIWLRHNFNSKYDFVSRFAKKYDDQKSIQKLVEYACSIATKKDINEESGGHRSAVIDMDENIGLSQKGKPTNKIQIFLDNNDYIKTAYPL